MGNTFANLFQQLMPSGVMGPAQCAFEGKSICRAVAFKHQPAQTQKGRTVVVPVVKAAFERA